MDGFPFQVEVVRTRGKKSASIHIDGEIVKVRVPKTLSEYRIRGLITRRTPWITTKLKELSATPPPKPKQFVSGESFPYLGKNYRLKVINGDRPSVKLKHGYLVVTTAKTAKDAPHAVKSLLEQWYQAHAGLRLADKTARWAKIVGVNPNSVAVKSYKARWGSCSINGDILFNWRLILMPHRIVDYVVIHELCHLVEHNHSPRFWQLVKRYAPDWKESRDWLKKNPVVF